MAVGMPEAAEDLEVNLPAEIYQKRVQIINPRALERVCGATYSLVRDSTLYHGARFL